MVNNEELLLVAECCLVDEGLYINVITYLVAAI